MHGKLKVVILASVMFSIFLLGTIFSTLEFVSENNNDSNPKKNIENPIRKIKLIEKGKKENKIEAQVKEENKNEDRLKNFESKDTNNINTEANISKEIRSSGGFYLDNINDLYNSKLVTLDEMFLIENRIKEISEDMPKLFREAFYIRSNHDALEKYFLKGDNKKRFFYLYGIDKEDKLKIILDKLCFLDNKEVISHGVISHIEGKDADSFQFVMDMYSTKEQSFIVNIQFKDKRAVLNINIE
ncbi:hypothetical protein BJV85_001833 [Clostridium acetobutylicum]|uniref:Uncharacterized protein n=1 Tax=Clostridium acetobutylicum (strain ATCC 824 / DSM 792 / JCM 1419 / IAM 19013 / LMG 5710 / NBRC 13948 / NRRL B-527 / VKM B-1787 / 2291 / W) TaxID=272562 RepID=Q97HG7_CLOAB|nr:MULTISPECIES: hypothetical protein [Clostridium]AAK80003.1 Hypothetical protein CA_C2044 [Clostridium acetobutylicum ATCC 824]ADZ21095.1 Conserved hypothetical protein [Clostridium acetobutylicum EA 2018]AEI32150.1 hypothetical protein SMB_G2076 [Clostridium acetobutylicum DSM 1731]AWV79567.1 hypothetical protein DK921_05525 [Clostridium acetobutylicum]MBC2394458.1 hypothetical protein [Clostridium acetobutylicum]